MDGTVNSAELLRLSVVIGVWQSVFLLKGLLKAKRLIWYLKKRTTFFTIVLCTTVFADLHGNTVHNGS